jgi:hypothetical protein
MTRRAVALLAWLLTVSMSLAWVWVIVEGDFMDLTMASQSANQQVVLSQGWWIVAYAAMAGLFVVSLGNATVGLLLASRRGGGRMGAILLAAGVAIAATPFGYAVGGSLAIRDPLDPLANALFLIGPASYAFAFSLILPVVALVYPDGRIPSPRWRWASGLAVGALATASILVLVKPGSIEGSASTNPFGVAILPEWLTGLAGPLDVIGSLLIAVLGVAAVVTRYRRGTRLERLQLRWFVAAVFLAAVPLAISIVGGGVGWFALAFPGVILVPVAVWIAVTRHGLYEIDRLISRGLSWAVLSGLLVAIYAGAVFLLQGALGGVIQGQTVAVAGSTLLAAALFQPLRRRVQSLVDRRFDRARYDGERTASDFSEQLRDEVDIDHLTIALATTAAGVVHPAGADVWLRPALGPKG